MSQKFKLDNQEYDVSDLTEKGKSTLISLQFTTQRLAELKNMQALLLRAKNSYVEGLKKEMISSKAGFMLEDH